LEYSDLIDTEPSYGDVYKMLLGSLDSNVDSIVNGANLPTTPIASPQSEGHRMSFTYTASESSKGAYTQDMDDNSPSREFALLNMETNSATEKRSNQPRAFHARSQSYNEHSSQQSSHRPCKSVSKIQSPH
jgi:hypothetical protein